MCSPSIGTAGDHSSALSSVSRRLLQSSSALPSEGLQMAQDFSHLPVLLEEVVGLFDPVPAGVVVDATLGGGGHAGALLRSRPDLFVVGFDRDAAARRAAAAALVDLADRVVITAGTFSTLSAVVAEGMAGARPWPQQHGAPAPVVGVLFDLGVSSPQLDDAERGFSYRADAPLDMRMDPSQGQTAAELLDSLDQRELTALLRENGEERLAGRIARAILAARPITSTAQLAEVVSSAVPAALRRKGHPARRVFQALRIAVNDELGELAVTLPAALEMLAPKGRCVVIAYHSGEDRLVKQAFRGAVTGGCSCPPQLPCVCGADPQFRLVFNGAHTAQDAELEQNHRAEAARLRAVERLVHEETS